LNDAAMHGGIVRLAREDGCAATRGAGRRLCVVGITDVA
jgi:hypothetical protein